MQTFRLYFICAIAVLLIVSLTSCTVYTEKQSEALSQAVYLADDSFELGRFDITDIALDNATKIVKPPKQRIEVKSVTKTPVGETVVEKQTSSENKKREQVIIVPEKFKGQAVIVVNTKEYEELLKDKKVYEQLQGDHKNLKKLKQTVDEELARQIEYNNQMVLDLNRLQKEVLSKRLLILKLYIVIAGMAVLMGGGIYLRMKGIL